jgi:phage-related protein
MYGMRNTRPISWVRAALKDFQKFPQPVRLQIETALTIAAEGRKADVAKPWKGLGSGVMEISVAYQTDAYRTIYITEVAGSLWVVHAFKKKSKKGRATPKQEVDLITDRVKRLRKELSQ